MHESRREYLTHHRSARAWAALDRATEPVSTGAHLGRWARRNHAMTLLIDACLIRDRLLHAVADRTKGNRHGDHQPGCR